MCKLIGYDPNAGKSENQLLVEKLLRGAGCSEKAIKALEENGYFHAPASARSHLAVPGGLVEHSLSVARHLAMLTRTLGITWMRPDGDLIVGLLHDLVKMRCYRFDSDGIVRMRVTYPGHGVASAMIADELGFELKEDERLAITFHMGVFGMSNDDMESFRLAGNGVHGAAVLATHFADWWSAWILNK